MKCLECGDEDATGYFTGGKPGDKKKTYCEECFRVKYPKSRTITEPNRVNPRCRCTWGSNEACTLHKHEMPF